MKLHQFRTEILERLALHGIQVRDREDVAQWILLAAVAAIREGRFTPDGHPDALRRWLVGITWRVAEHHRSRAHHRREVLAGLRPHEEAEEPSLDPWPQFLARELLRDLAALPVELRDAATLYGLGFVDREIGEAQGIVRRTASERVRRAREMLSTPK